jgi:hypothetical protein
MPKEFDKKMAMELAPQVEQELAALGERLGLNISYAGGTLDGPRFIMKLSIDIAGVDKAAEDFKKYAPTLGLQIDDLGKEIVVGGRKFVISGWRTTGKGSQSAPVVATEVGSGKGYLFKASQVKLALGREVSDWEKLF